MSYLKESTHFRNWLFTAEELQLVAQLKQLKVRKALRLARNPSQKQQQQSALHNHAIKPRSFAALIPANTTAIRDENDWNEDLDLAKLQQQDQQEQEEFDKLQTEKPLMPELLTRDEEDTFLWFYQEKIQESCAQLFRTSDKVKACAVMLYKRFYLSNSAMEFHPKYLVPTCIYVASKVEEQYISVDTIADQLQVDHKYVIGHEMILLEGVRFQLIMYHPFRSCLGFVDDLRNFFTQQQQEIPLEVLQQLHSNSCVVINELLLSDLPLMHTPSYIALGALYIVAKQLASKDKGSENKDKNKSKPKAELTDANVLRFFEETQQKKLKEDAIAMEVFRQTLQSIEAKYEELMQLKLEQTNSANAAKAVERTKLVKSVYKKLKKFFEDDDAKSGSSKKRKADANGKSDDKKKDKKKKHKHKKDKEKKKEKKE